MAARLREKLRNSQRYYIIEDVTRAATRLGVNHPNILLEMLHRARAPFDRMWIEWPLDPQMEEAQRFLEYDAPARVGCFVELMSDEEPIYRLTMIGGPPRNERSSQISIPQVAVLYHLHTPIHEVRNLETGAIRIAQDIGSKTRRTLVGAAYMEHVDDGADEEEKRQRTEYCNQLTEYASWIVNPMLANWHRAVMSGKHDHRKLGMTTPGITGIVEDRNEVLTPKQGLMQGVINGVNEYSGMWRFAVATLALINAHNFIQQEGFRFGKTRTQLVSGNVIPYLDHIMVRLKLPRHVVEKKMLKSLAEASPRKRHGVAGSWREWHHRGDPDCDHAYIDVTQTRQRCTICGHAQWWVPAYQRGDARLGFVIKDTVVTRR